MSKGKLRIDVMDGFARAAMQKLLMSEHDDGSVSDLATRAYAIADEMMNERERWIEKREDMTKSHIHKPVEEVDWLLRAQDSTRCE